MMSAAKPPRMLFGVRLPIAALLIFSGVFFLATVALGMFYAGAQSLSERTARALRLATANDVVVESFTGEAGTGKLYYRPAGETMLVVITGLPVLDKEEKYQVWFLKAGQVYNGQRMKLDADGAGRVIQEPAPPGSYDEIRVTREKSTAALPEGPVLVTWKKR